MMILQLVKKDCLLAKKNLFWSLLAGFGIPLFFAWRAPSLLGMGAFILTIMMLEVILMQTVSLADMTYPKASALLCAVPYERSAIVKAKYLFSMLIFLYCLFAYGILAVILPQMTLLSPFQIILSLFLLTVFYGTYIPLEYKFGYEKTKIFLLMSVIVIPYLLPMVLSRLPKFNLNSLMILPEAVLGTILSAAAVVVAFISVRSSIKIFSVKDL